MAKTRSQISTKRKRDETNSPSSLSDRPVMKKEKKSGDVDTMDSKTAIKASRKSSKKPKSEKAKEKEINNNTLESKSVVKKELKLTGDSELSRKEKMFVGAHVSISGGIEKAPENATAIGAKAFALFLRNQRTWNCKPMKEGAAEKFRKGCEIGGFPPSMIVPHGSYLLNCGAPNPDTLQKSREALVDELKRCEMLGLTKYNFHPGSTCGQMTVDECLDRIAASIDLAHKATKYCTTLIENMSCQGNTVGGKFEEIRGIIDRVQDKSRMGVCLDTCHAMAAGYDLSKKAGYDRMMTDFERIIGLKYLQAIHLNDSKGEAGCHLDRHENIGRGKIGMEGFLLVMKDPRLEDVPMVLETPLDVDDAVEIQLLYSLCST